MLNISNNLKLSIILLLIGFVVHFVGFVSPYWNVVPDVNTTTSTTPIRLGLWKSCYKYGTADKCIQYTALGEMIAPRLFETVSVILYVLSLLSFWLYRRHPVYGGAILITCMLFIILIIETTAVGALCWVTIRKIQDSYTLSWAFIVTVASVIFPVIAGWFVSEERRSFMQQCRRNSLGVLTEEITVRQ